MVLNNSWPAFVTDYDNGKMDGFDLVWVNEHQCTCAYQYVKPSQIKPYWSMAKQYVLADHMFPTQASGSFTAHLDLIRGDTKINSYESLIDFPPHGPWGCDAAPGIKTSLLTDTQEYLYLEGPFPCFTFQTMRDLLDAKSVSWKYYTPSIKTHGGDIWNPFDAIQDVRNGSEWGTNVTWPETTIFTDISSGNAAGGFVGRSRRSKLRPSGAAGLGNKERHGAVVGGPDRERRRSELLLELERNRGRVG